MGMNKNVIHKLSNNVLLETLENRALMSAVNLTAGVLILEGDSGSANKLTVSVDATGQWVTATANDVTKSFAMKDVQMARLIGGELGDTVNVGEPFARPTYVRTGAGNDSITTGRGAASMPARIANSVRSVVVRAAPIIPSPGTPPRRATRGECRGSR